MVVVAAVPGDDVVVGAGAGAVTVREFDDLDRSAVERLERACEVGPASAGKKLCLFTDLLGDPLCRVRHSPAFLMLVAEFAGGEVVGVVRGCVKTVSCGGGAGHGHDSNNNNNNNNNNNGSLFSKVAYLLGLRVSPAHRRRGIGRALVSRMEEWFRQCGAEYAYVATDRANEPSVRLFTSRCGYSKFRSPSVLVHPVFRHDLPPLLPTKSRSSSAVAVLRLSPRDAERLYRSHFAGVEFFPRDIDAVLSNPLSLGTFLAVPSDYHSISSGDIDIDIDISSFLAAPPSSWAVASVWNSKDAFRLEVRGAPRLWRAAARATRAADAAFSFLKIPSVPNLFEPFGMHFLYGLGGEGEEAARMVTALCRHAHNVARAAGARVVATEVAACDPLRRGVPCWKRLGAEDLWCIKRLGDGYGGGDGGGEGGKIVGDWTKKPPGKAIFVDPREF